MAALCYWNTVSAIYIFPFYSLFFIDCVIRSTNSYPQFTFTGVGAFVVG